MAVVGKLTASLIANTSQFNRKMRGASRTVKRNLEYLERLVDEQRE